MSVHCDHAACRARLSASGELDRRLGREAAELKTHYDVAIVGGGPAGLAAAMYAARKNLSAIVVAMNYGGRQPAGPPGDPSTQRRGLSR